MRRRVGPGLAIVIAVATGCGAPPARAPRPPAPRAPALPPPAAIEGGARGAPYLSVIAGQLQPRWAQFLEDCRLRLPPDDPLNAPALSATAELAIDRAGGVEEIRIATSGNADFDLAVRDVLAEVPRVEAPPAELLSDDDRLHLRWLFARDRRQAGPATATLGAVTLPVGEVTARLLAQDELPRAARRVLAASPGDPDRLAAAELVMIGALREALGTSVAARIAAVHAIGRTRIAVLAPEVRAFLSPTTDPEVRIAAITTAAALADEAAIALIAAPLPADLRGDARLALVATAALVELGQGERAAAVIRRVLEAEPSRPSLGALHAHALAPTAALGARLVTWFTRGDARRRAAVCAAVPGHTAAVPAYPAAGPAYPVAVAVIVGRGLRDPDARVRAACADAAARLGQGRVLAATVRRLRELRRDRDQLVRARAVAALVVVDPGPRPAGDAATDPAPEVRAAAVVSANELELRGLATDPDPEVRARAITQLSDRASELVQQATTDAAPQVRSAAIVGLADEAALARLAHDPSPDVATAALVQLAARRGRAAMTAPLLTQLGTTPAGSVERVRIALAWLLAR